MQSRIQPAHSKQPGPIWLRMLAMVCVLLLCVASTVQVCHVHGELTPTSKDSRQQVPDHCPLCVAMHSTLPATAQATPEPVLQVQAVTQATLVVLRLQRWHYELFSRPPPAVPSMA